jgi:hypothetical protein
MSAEAHKALVRRFYTVQNSDMHIRRPCHG